MPCKWSYLFPHVLFKGSGKGESPNLATTWAFLCSLSLEDHCLRCWRPTSMFHRSVGETIFFFSLLSPPICVSFSMGTWFNSPEARFVCIANYLQRFIQTFPRGMALFLWILFLSLFFPARRPPVEETVSFLQSLLASHGPNYLEKLFGPKARDALMPLGGVQNVAIALSGNPFILSLAPITVPKASTEFLRERIFNYLWSSRIFLGDLVGLSLLKGLPFLIRPVRGNHLSFSWIIVSKRKSGYPPSSRLCISFSWLIRGPTNLQICSQMRIGFFLTYCERFHQARGKM